MTRFTTPAALLAAAALAAGGTATALLSSAHADPASPAPAGTNATAADVRELSAVFRGVADRVMPGIVSIEARVPGTEREVPGTTRRGQSPFGQQGPFGGMDEETFRRFFGDDPRLEQFFRQQQQNPNRPRRRMRTPDRTNSGSGVVIDPEGLILTNSHVVNGAEEVVLRFEDGREFTATDVRTDPRSDVAVVRIDPETLGDERLTAVPMGDSARAEIGDWVLAFGSPLGQQFSMSAGIVSGKSRVAGLSERENYLQHDAAINPGNSGGPLVNLDGEIIALNTAISSRGGGYDGIGFAIPVNQAKWIADQLADAGAVTRSYLGVGIQQLDSDLAAQFGVDPLSGVAVNNVIDGTPAAKAGVQTGDVIVRVADRPVRSTTAVQDTVERLTPGEAVDLVVLRDGDEVTLSLVPEAQPTGFSTVGTFRNPATPAEPEAAAVEDYGLELAELTDEYRERLELDDDVAGVLVTGVTDGGPADRAGLTAGTVVERVGREPVDTVDALREQLAAAAQSENPRVLLLVRTDAGTRFVTLRAE